jgi:hypothetical protein
MTLENAFSKRVKALAVVVVVDYLRVGGFFQKRETPPPRNPIVPLRIPLAPC